MIFQSSFTKTVFLSFLTMEVFYSITVLIFSIFLIALKYHFQEKKQQLILLPPSPPALPILGHLHYLRKTAPQFVFQKLSNKYGPLISLRFGIRPILLVSSPSLADECFTKTNDIVFANRPPSISSKYLGYNFTSVASAPYGDLWRNLRRVTTIHIFSSISLRRYSTIWLEEIRFTVQKMFSTNPDGDGKTWKTVDMKSLFQEFIYNVIMKMVAGKRWEADHSGDSFSPRLTKVTDVCDYIPFLRWIGYRGLEKTVISEQRKRDKFLQDLIDETRKKEGEKAGSCSGDHERTRTIIETLLDLQVSEPEYYTDEIIKGIIQVMFVAGTHTSSLTMEWAMSCLLNHPEVLQKAKTEIDENVTPPGRMIEVSDLSNLPYLHCIINETLRIFPPAPTLLPHYSSEACTIGGYKVPKGTTLLVNAWAIHRDPDVWEEPDKFIPERFEGIDVGSKFLPFGKGRRACPGAALAMTVVGLALGTLIQCFEWKREGSEMVNLEEKHGSTLSKSKPLEALYKPRLSMIN